MESGGLRKKKAYGEPVRWEDHCIMYQETVALNLDRWVSDWQSVQGLCAFRPL